MCVICFFPNMKNKTGRFRSMFDKKEQEYQTPSVEELKLANLVKGLGGDDEGGDDEGGGVKKTDTDPSVYGD